jgi:hypothetical protein
MINIIFKNITRLLEFTQPLTEMSTRNIKKTTIMFLGSKVLPVRAIYEPIV